jgi:hypothetical protein
MGEKKKSPKKMARRRKKPNGIEGVLYAIFEMAASGIRLYHKAKPLIYKPKPKKKKQPKSKKSNDRNHNSN